MPTARTLRFTPKPSGLLPRHQRFLRKLTVLERHYPKAMAVFGRILHKAVVQSRRGESNFAEFQAELDALLAAIKRGVYD